ncbi:MAG: translation initiation factor IF-3 [Candidatus Omnitrophica bacterium]|nr:translation initiation factor IF-3 [Candidatus Omnitrophota bacterium]MDD5672251.1 translation initiation factor IF-3 [Candidatus Omnitrophota bacterium]
MRINEKIRVPQVRLIGATGEQIGIVPVKEALTRSQEAELDLVEVAPEANPPVCRIMDFGKYLYALNKKEKESRKKQKVIDVKEIKLSSKIEEHDYQTKLRNGRRFLERGDKVKLSMFFRGREVQYKQLGERILNRFVEDVADVGEIERNDGFDGRSFLMYLMPISHAKKKTSLDTEEKKEKGPDNAKNENEQSS